MSRHDHRTPAVSVVVAGYNRSNILQYADPDHWRVPLDSPEVPDRWSGGPVRPAF